MITVHLTNEEEMLLVNMVETCISDLHSEIIRTEDHDYKLMLKNRKLVLHKLLDALHASENSSREGMITP